LKLITAFEVFGLFAKIGKIKLIHQIILRYIKVFLVIYYLCIMAKRKSAWFCSSCGNESPKWMGRCPACGEWNSMVEEPKSSAGTGGGASGRNRNLIQTQDARPQLLTGITFDEEQRFSIGNTELDRILGGGMVQGSMILIGGEPGIGKSTLSLQIPLHASGLKTLYVSGEESAVQIKLRAQRLQGDDSQCYVLGETLLENILVQAKEVKPSLLIIDSIQTIYSENIESSAGSVSQVRECASVLLRYAKESNVPVILIGHITRRFHRRPENSGAHSRCSAAI